MYFLIEYIDEEYDRKDFKIIGFSENENELGERLTRLSLLNNEEANFYNKTVEMFVKKYQLDLNYYWSLYLLTNNKPSHETYFKLRTDFGNSVLEKIDPKIKKYITMKREGDFYCSRSNRSYEILELEKSFYE